MPAHVQARVCLRRPRRRRQDQAGRDARVRGAERLHSVRHCSCPAGWAASEPCSQQPSDVPPVAPLQVELLHWKSVKELTNDGGVIKKIKTEGSGWENPKDVDEVTGASPCRQLPRSERRRLLSTGSRIAREAAFLTCVTSPLPQCPTR